jgi:hypothetical protein
VRIEGTHGKQTDRGESRKAGKKMKGKKWKGRDKEGPHPAFPLRNTSLPSLVLHPVLSSFTFFPSFLHLSSFLPSLILLRLSSFIFLLFFLHLPSFLSLQKDETTSSLALASSSRKEGRKDGIRRKEGRKMAYEGRKEG